MAETFANSITGLMFDGQTLRIEFGVTRFDEVKPNTQITGRRYPACRLVLPPAAAVELINRMQQIANALTQAGVVKATPRPPRRSRRRADASLIRRAGQPGAGASRPLLLGGAPQDWRQMPFNSAETKDIKVSLCLYCRSRRSLL